MDNVYAKLRNNAEYLGLVAFRDGLDAVIDAVNSGQIDVVEGLYRLTEAEASSKRRRTEEAMVKVSHFPYRKTFDDYDFSWQPGLNAQEVRDLANLRFVENMENVVFLGTPGVGKTHLAISIGIEAAKASLRTYFVTCHDLIADLKRAKSENTLQKRLKFYYSYSVLIVDEVGFLPVEKEDSDLLFQLISMRYERKSTIFTSNKGFNHWGEVLGDAALANAMLDRILHHCRIFEIIGPSYRMKGKESLFREDNQSR